MRTAQNLVPQLGGKEADPVHNDQTIHRQATLSPVSRW